MSPETGMLSETDHGHGIDDRPPDADAAQRHANAGVRKLQQIHLGDGHDPQDEDGLPGDGRGDEPADVEHGGNYGV